MSEQRPSVLWLTPQTPDFLVGGGGIRQAHLLTALAHHADVDLVVAGPDPLTDDGVRAACRSVVEHQIPDDAGGNRLSARFSYLRSALGPEGPREVFIARTASRAVRNDLARLDPDSYDVVIVQHAAFVRLLPPHRRSRWIAEMHRFASGDMQQLRAITEGARQRWIFGQEEQSALRLERWIAANYDLVIGVSGEDLAHLPGEHVIVPNGVDTRRLTPSPVPSAHRAVMTGLMGTMPNITGARWFCEQVLPLVRAAVPDAGVDLVGASPADTVLALGELPGVTVHGAVPDIKPYLDAARVCVVPLVMGSGTRLKALEALASGRPLVGTSIGLVGLGIVDGTSGLIADTPEAFAQAVISVFRDDGLADTLATGGAGLVDRHAWDTVAESYVAAVLPD